MAKQKQCDVSEPSLIRSELEKLGCKIMNSLEELSPKRFLSTGLFSFDAIISKNGGIPGNATIEIFGPNSTGKTSVALQIAAQAQQQKMMVYYINSERAINPSILSCFPELDPTKVDWIKPDTGEAAINIMKTILKTQTDVLVINDSIPACLPSVIADARAEDSTIGQLARLFSPFMPEAKKWCEANQNILIQLNQERAKIGPMVRGGMEQPGGKAIKFYSDIRIKLVKRFQNGDIKSGGETVGHVIEAQTVKTRWAPPGQNADLPLIYGKGFDIGREILACAVLYGVIIKKGAWYSYYKPGETEPEHKTHGEDQMAILLNQEPDFAKEVKERLSVVIE